MVASATPADDRANTNSANRSCSNAAISSAVSSRNPGRRSRTTANDIQTANVQQSPPGIVILHDSSEILKSCRESPRDRGGQRQRVNTLLSQHQPGQGRSPDTKNSRQQRHYVRLRWSSGLLTHSRLTVCPLVVRRAGRRDARRLQSE